MRHHKQEARFFAVRPRGPDQPPPFRVLLGWRWMAAGVATGATVLVAMLALPRRRARILRVLAAGGAVGSFAALANGLHNALFPALKQIDLALEGLPHPFAGLRVMHISDMHVGAPLTRRAVRRALALARAAQPDLILLTGDFVSYTRHLDLLPTLLGTLQAPLGMYASLGNHDQWTQPATLARILDAAGIRLLVNQHCVVTRGGARLIIAGVDDVWSGKPDLEAALLDAPADVPVILLAHSPDYADVALHAPVALQLAGHSHGGHIRLPLLGPLMLPRHGIRYDRGLHRLGRMTLYVSHGVGGWPLRIGCRSEVTLFTLRPA